MLFNTTLTQIKNQIYPILKQPIEVPLPKDAGGGYTHEQHKRNYNNMYNAGVLFQLTEKKRICGICKKNAYTICRNVS